VLRQKNDATEAFPPAGIVDGNESDWGNKFLRRTNLNAVCADLKTAGADLKAVGANSKAAGV
jgi:hypothetical protein